EHALWTADRLGEDPFGLKRGRINLIAQPQVHREILLHLPGILKKEAILPGAPVSEGSRERGELGGVVGLEVLADEADRSGKVIHHLRCPSAVGGCEAG